MAAPTRTGEASTEAELAGSTPAASAFARLLPFVALVGLAIRFAYAIGWRWDAGLKYDGPAYVARAEFLRLGRGFLDTDAWIFHQEALQGAVHPPVNTLVLAAGQQLGFSSRPSLQLWACLVGTATIVVVGFLGRAVAGPRAGLIAASIAAVAPTFWSNDPTLMAETPAQLLTALTLLLAYGFWSRPTPSRAGWMAAAAAAAGLARSELVLLLPVLVLPLCLAAPGPWRRTATRLAAAALWSTAVLGPWVGWNLVRFEHPTTIATGLDISLAYAQCDDTWYGPRTGYWNVFCGAEIPDLPANELADQSDLGRQYRAEASAYISEHRSRWPVVIAARVGRTAGLFRPAQQVQLEIDREGREGPVTWALLLTTYATYALAVVAFARARPSRRRLLPLLTPLACGLAGAALTFGATRYRSAGEVGLTVLAAIGIDALGRWRARGADGLEYGAAGPDGVLAAPDEPEGSRRGR